jgi:hypothetical protein
MVADIIIWELEIGNWEWQIQLGISLINLTQKNQNNLGIGNWEWGMANTISNN